MGYFLIISRDNPDSDRIMEALRQDHYWEPILVADTAEKAVAAARREMPFFIFLSDDMWGKGWEIGRQVRALPGGGGPPILVFTTSPDNPNPKEMRGIGAGVHLNIRDAYPIQVIGAMMSASRFHHAASKIHS